MSIVHGQPVPSGVTPGSYGSGAAVPVLTVDATGRVTAASTAAIAGGDPMDALLLARRDGLVTQHFSSAQVGDEDTIPVLTVDIQGRVTAATSAAAAIALKAKSLGRVDTLLSPSGVSPGSAGDSTNVPVLTVDAFGRVTGLSSAAISFPSADPLAGLPLARRNDDAPSGVVPGAYTNSTVTVDALGKVTSAASGASPVTSVSGTAPISSSGGATPIISHDTTAVTPGAYTNASITVDATGHLTAASSGADPVTDPLIGLITDRRSELPPSGVVPGAYTYSSITVDAQGKLTSAVSGAAPVTTVTATAPLSSSGGATPDISHDNSAVAPGSYTYASITVDAKGHLSAASSGTSPITDPLQGVLTDRREDVRPTGVTPGSYGSASQAVVLTIDAHGRVSSASTASISAGSEAAANTKMRHSFFGG